MISYRFPFILALLLLTPSECLGAEPWRVGMAQVSITPAEPIHLLGYSNRDAPFTSVDADIYAKALAIEDAQGHRGVIVSTDLVGIQEWLFREVCEKIESRTGLQRSQILLNASHNHTGPLLSLHPVTAGTLAYGKMTESEAARTVAYTQQLRDKIVELVVESLADMQPARLSWGASSVQFVMNRRLGPAGAIAMAPNSDGPVDRVVPVLKVVAPDGNLRCVLFGCACHNTTLTSDHNLISGDYAGYAQQQLQEKFPGAQAMFLSGCGADANPEPRGGIDVAKRHGAELADAVGRALDGPQSPLSGPLATAYEVVDLPLQTLTAEQLSRIEAGGSSQAFTAGQLGRLLREGETLRPHYPAPIAAWGFGKELTLVALPGEGVSGYAELIQRRLKSRKLWISSYNNDCFGYLPTAQIVREGGHEALGVTVWFWGTDLAEHVGFFAEEVEHVVVEAAARLAEQVQTNRTTQ